MKTTAKLEKDGTIKFKDGWVAPSSQDHMICVDGRSWYMRDYEMDDFIKALKLSRKTFKKLNKKAFPDGKGGGWTDREKR